MNTTISFELAKLLKEKDEQFDVTSTLDYPTIDEVKWWMYEKHGIWISVTENPISGFSWHAANNEGHDYNSPIEAYEAAIEHTLNNLL